MLNGLSLFTGIGGIDLALSEWVRPVAYCEIEQYAAKREAKKYGRLGYYAGHD